ncbi:MAG TPA: hypothetical protein VMU09_00190 [Acidimicrobiales bacterium]|nr:hypothetical protein [Acidimicrobiales bacterium]
MRNLSKGLPVRRLVTDSTVFNVGGVLTLVATALTLVVTCVRAFTGFQVLTATFLVFVASTIVLLMVEIRRRSDRIHNIVDISDRIAASSPATAAYKRIGTSLGDVLEGYPSQPEITIAWQTAVHRCSETLAQLAQGHLVTRTSDQTYKLAFLNRGLPLKATSLLRTNLEFWTSPDGEEYWHEQVRSLREGFTIQRIFICQARTDAVTELVQRHADAGVETFVVDEYHLAPDDRVDITLWGSEAVFYKQFQQRPAGTGQWYDRFSFRRTDVDETSRQYERILRVATPVPSARATADVIARLEREGMTLAID